MIDQLLSSNVYQALVNASSPSAINPYITASVITSGYVPYIGATSNLNLGTFSLTAGLITTPSVIGGTANGSFITYKSTTGAGTSSNLAHSFIGGTNGGTTLFNLYNDGQVITGGGTIRNPTTFGNFRIAQSTSLIDMGFIAANQAAIWIQKTTPSSTNYTITADASTTIFNGVDSLIFSTSGTERFRVNRAQTSGSLSTFTWSSASNTGQTASTNIPGFLFTTGSRQWNTGAITTQEEIRITSPTYSFVGASTITNAYTLFVNSPTAGTNATITNNYALGLNGDISLEGGNRIIRGSNSIEIIHGAGSNYRVYTGSTLRVDRNPTSVSYYNGTATSGAVVGYLFTSSSNTGQTASTEIPSFKMVNATRTWAAGAITTQREFYITSPTYAFASASTITNSYGLYVEAATAGTNATITNNWGLGVSGSAAVGGKLFVTSTLGSIPEGYDLEVNKSVSGGVESLIRNTSNGSASFTKILVRGDGSQQLNMIVFSSGFTPAGLILQNSTALYTGGTSVSNLLIGHYSASREIHFLSGSTTSAIHTMNRGGQTSGAYSNFEWSPISNTGQTASTEINGYLYNSYSRQWAAGAINTQRERYYKTVTYAFASASTITDAYGAYFEAPTAGTNATITNNYAAGFSGAIQVTNNTTQIDDFIGDVTGSRRLRLWNIKSSTTSLTQLDVQNNGSTISSLGVTSGAYTGTGVLTSNTHFFIAQNGTAGNSVLYGANNVSMRIKFINGGFATTNVAFEIDNNNNIICGNAALNTTATNGFLYLPSCAGVPTGVPTAITGKVPIVVDSTNNKAYIYSGGAWVALN